MTQDRTVSFRVSPEELLEIDARAHAAGVKNRSEYARRVALGTLETTTLTDRVMALEQRMSALER